MGEWNGPWSDGSSEWNAYWMEKLEHTFGDDGLFWMSFEDLLNRFEMLDRTRIFDSTWTRVQSWTSVSVAWVTGYMNTKFMVEIRKKGPTVFQLCQVRSRLRKPLHYTDYTSLMIDIFEVWRESTGSICTSFCKRKTLPPATTSFALVALGLGTVVFRLRSIWSRASMR